MLLTTPPPPFDPPRRTLVHRHAVFVRLSHWLNVVYLIFLLASGLQIFNAHPRLYLGKFGADNDPAVLEIASTGDGEARRGRLRVGSLSVPTTGVLGASKEDGAIVERAFPGWMTLPSYHDLGAGRRWHFTFAWLLLLNGLGYMAYGFFRGHFRRDLLPTRDQLTRRNLWHEVRDHARLRFPKGEEARRYNALQKLTYLLVIFGLLPAMVVTGLAMSPGGNAVLPHLVDALGGRATARTLHFFSAFSIVAFVVVHVAMVVASGLWNNLRSMITGRYAIDRGPDTDIHIDIDTVGEVDINVDINVDIEIDSDPGKGKP
ncbi:cytochrome b/b6 domain-containing protein [Mitsuaria sp. 7]|uniref:cytochrome b/b6 domain-containing protein n=1 Tax=Mitsuaria sp. 7 TaxID=1658665 RepID=UPI00082FD9B4|nr:cytochrome b/b6 domain-containing protein [Mitsuaria sp. 7]